MTPHYGVEKVVTLGQRITVTPLSDKVPKTIHASNTYGQFSRRRETELGPLLFEVPILDSSTWAKHVVYGSRPLT